MDFVGRYGLVEAVQVFAPAHPLGVKPIVLRLEDDRGGLWRLFAGECEWICLVELAAAESRQQTVLVARPDRGAGDEAFPDSRGGMR